MAREFGRPQRVGEQIQRELAMLMQRELKDPRVGMATVSAVEVSRDLAYATIYVTFLDKNDPKEIEAGIAALQHASIDRDSACPTGRIRCNAVLNQGS